MPKVTALIGSMIPKSEMTATVKDSAGEIRSDFVVIIFLGCHFFFLRFANIQSIYLTAGTVHMDRTVTLTQYGDAVEQWSSVSGVEISCLHSQ